MDDWKQYLLSWFPMVLLVGVRVYVMRKHNACKASGSTASDEFAQEQLAIEREKLLEARRMNGFVEQLLKGRSARIDALESRLENPPFRS